MFRLIPLLAWLSLGAAAAATAQTAGADSLAARLAAVARIRTHSAAGWAELEHPRLVGDSLSFDRGQLIDGRGGRRSAVASPLPLAGIDRIDARAGTHAGRGALVGGLIGGGLGLALGIAMSQDDFFQASPGEVAAVTLVFGAGGAGLGALIGALVPRWRPVYRRGGAP